MIFVLIWGTGSLCSNIEKIINKDSVDILAYIDNDKSKINGTRNNKKILQPSDISKIPYDYIIIASSYYNDIISQIKELNVEVSKIINGAKYLEDLLELEYAKMDKAELLKNYQIAINSDDIETIITGLSYAKYAVNPELLKYKAVNCALPKQDLYYDFNIVKNIINFGRNKLKVVIIGLSYYSFEYDESLSKAKLRSFYLYKDIVNLLHNYNNVNNNLGNLFMLKNEVSKNFKIEAEKYISEYSIRNFQLKSVDDKIYEGKKVALINCKKNYPKTVQENKHILESYLKLLNENNIKAIICIFPVTRYYRNYFDIRLKEQFYYILNEICKSYNFTILDFFSSNKFCEYDFRDSSHLNLNGANKFTKIINDLI